MKLVSSIIFLLSGIIVASESEPIRAAVQTGREAETKAIHETDTEAKALMADFLHPSPDLLRREAVDTSCEELVPGLKRFQCGVDGARLDLISLEQGEDDGFKNPVVYFTCKEGKKAKIPTSTGKKIYDQPDQIGSVAAIHAGFSSNKADVMKTRSDVSNFFSANAGIGDPTGLFKLSASYSKMTAMVDEKKKSLASSKHVVPAFAAHMLPATSLQATPHIENYIKKHLNNTFEKDPEPYRQFINQWGTHFFQKANFGGLIRVLMEMDSSFAKKQTEQKIGAEASGVIEAVKLSGGFESESKSMNSEFQKHTSVTKRILGGDYTRFLNDGFKGWQTTVAEKPWLYKGKLMSIHLLFKDAKKGKEMHKAIKEHMMKAQLEVAMRQAKMKLPLLIGDPHIRKKYMKTFELETTKELELQSYIDRCDELIKGFPNENEVKELNRQIEKAMLWPVCRLEDNVRYSGHDFSYIWNKATEPTWKDSATSVYSCVELCLNNYYSELIAKCAGFTYDKNDNACWLHSAMTGREENAYWAQSAVCTSP